MKVPIDTVALRLFFAQFVIQRNTFSLVYRVLDGKKDAPFVRIFPRVFY